MSLSIRGKVKVENGPWNILTMYLGGLDSIIPSPQIRKRFRMTTLVRPTLPL